MKTNKIVWVKSETCGVHFHYFCWKQCPGKHRTTDLFVIYRIKIKALRLSCCLKRGQGAHDTCCKSGTNSLDEMVWWREARPLIEAQWNRRVLALFSKLGAVGLGLGEGREVRDVEVMWCGDVANGFGSLLLERILVLFLIVHWGFCF